MASSRVVPEVRLRCLRGAMRLRRNPPSAMPQLECRVWSTRGTGRRPRRFVGIDSRLHASGSGCRVVQPQKAPRGWRLRTRHRLCRNDRISTRRGIGWSVLPRARFSLPVHSRQSAAFAPAEQDDAVIATHLPIWPHGELIEAMKPGAARDMPCLPGVDRRP